MTPKRILVLMSDTGGGHRAAAEAIQAAAAEKYPGELEFNLVDVFRHYTPFPFKYAPEIYPIWVNNASPLWFMSYESTNARQSSAIAVKFLTAYWGRGLSRMLAEHPADMILSVHSIVARPVMQVLQRSAERPPFMTVVTDLVTTHAFWYDPQIDRCLVPTQNAYDRGLKFGLRPDQLQITGLPVHPDFTRQLTDKASARRELDIESDLPAVLLISGGEGMGPLLEIAETINQKRLPCQLLIVAGRNETLLKQLIALEWNLPARIFGFVNNMPLLMAAADMMVTKAGPATISEAFIAGLPIILSGALPGQEDGNVKLVVENDAGVYVPSPAGIADTIATWLAGDELQRRSVQAKKLAQPEAVWTILEEVRTMAQRVPQTHAAHQAASRLAVRV